MHKLSKPPKEIFSQDPRKSSNQWLRKTPKNTMIVTTRKSGPSYDVWGEGESSTPETQAPTDGSYIIDTESCNI